MIKMLTIGYLHIVYRGNIFEVRTEMSKKTAECERKNYTG